MTKKTIIHASDKVALELKILAAEKESVRRKLVVTATQLAKTAKEKELIRLKLAVTAKEKEVVRKKLEVTAKRLAATAEEKENIRSKLAVNAKKLAVTAKEKESVRKKLVVTAKQLVVIAKKLAVTAQEKEDVRRKLVVTAEKLKGSYETLENKVLERTKDLAYTKIRDEAILESIGDGLVAVDNEGKILMVNNAFESLVGYKGKEVLGKLLVEVVTREDEAGNVVPFQERVLNKILSTTTTTTTTTTTDWYYIRKDKTRFPAASIITPFILEGKIIGAVEIFRDITKEKEIDKAKTEFISLASHQLRTPLTTISWYTEMILKGDVGQVIPGQKKYLEEIYGGNQRMIELVNTMLDLSRLELGTFVIKPEPVQLKNIAESVLIELGPQIIAQKLTIDKHYDPSLPIISADSKFTRMIFQNLLSNAVQYVSINGKIRLDISTEKSGILIKVWNSGTGIPKEDQSKIFTKFFRDDLAKQKDPDGNGLGLYIVKSILEKSGGKAWFESEENKGTTFYVTFPLDGMKKKEGYTQLS